MKTVFAVSSMAAVASATSANPIRRVVTLLQDMQSQIETELREETASYEKFECWCKTGESDDKKTIQAAFDTRDAALERSKSQEAAHQELDAAVAQAKADRQSDKDDIKSATNTRNEENKDFNKFSSETSQNIDALGRGIGALRKGLGQGAFLQTNAAASLKKVISSISDSVDIDANNREEVLAFLESGSDAGNSDEIVGILSQMKETMEKDLSEAEATEASALKAFNERVAGLQKSIQRHTDAIENKQQASAAAHVAAVEAKNEAEDQQKLAEATSAALANKMQSCADNDKLYKDSQESSRGELEAIGQAIAVLNDDDALMVFHKSDAKGSRAAPAFLQRSANKNKVKTAKNFVKSIMLSSKSPVVALLASTVFSKLSSKSVDFKQVIAMIDTLVKTLKSEQKTDNSERANCEQNLADNEQAKTDNTRENNELSAKIANLKANIESANQKIEELTDAIATNDKQVAEATAERKENNSAFNRNSKLNDVAVQLIEKAKNKLNAFYNPQLVTEKPLEAPGVFDADQRSVAERQAEADRQAAADLASVAASFVQIKAHVQQPEIAFSKKKSSGSSTILALLGKLQKELKVTNATLASDEKAAQSDYEGFLSRSSTQRAESVKSKQDQEEFVANTSVTLNDSEAALASGNKSLASTVSTIADLHSQCDFLLEHFELRKDARTSEREGLVNAKAALKGAK